MINVTPGDKPIKDSALSVQITYLDSTSIDSSRMVSGGRASSSSLNKFTKKETRNASNG